MAMVVGLNTTTEAARWTNEIINNAATIKVTLSSYEADVPNESFWVTNPRDAREIEVGDEGDTMRIFTCEVDNELYEPEAFGCNIGDTVHLPATCIEFALTERESQAWHELVTHRAEKYGQENVDAKACAEFVIDWCANNPE